MGWVVADGKGEGGGGEFVDFAARELVFVQIRAGFRGIGWVRGAGVRTDDELGA